MAGAAAPVLFWGSAGSGNEFVAHIRTSSFLRVACVPNVCSGLWCLLRWTLSEEVILRAGRSIEAALRPVSHEASSRRKSWPRIPTGTTVCA